jgi:hypothetical protein
MQVIAEPTWIIVMHHTGTAYPSNLSFLPTYFRAITERTVLKQRTDCGMTHYYDPVVRDSLLKIAPSKKEEIEAMSFGEITGS